MIRGTSRGSLRTSTMSPASTATSVPAPMAIPTSAVAKAGASLTPSPTIATRLPLSFPVIAPVVVVYAVLMDVARCRSEASVIARQRVELVDMAEEFDLIPSAFADAASSARCNWRGEPMRRSEPVVLSYGRVLEPLKAHNETHNLYIQWKSKSPAPVGFPRRAGPLLVGATGFEPATTCTPSGPERCAAVIGSSQVFRISRSSG